MTEQRAAGAAWSTTTLEKSIPVSAAIQAAYRRTAPKESNFQNAIYGNLLSVQLLIRKH